MRTAAFFTATVLAASLAQAGDTGSFTYLPFTPHSVSADGKTAVGDNTGTDKVWMWTAAGGVVEIGGVSQLKPGAGQVYVNANGSTVWGASLDANNVRNLSSYDVAAGTWTSMGGLGGYSYSPGLSPDPAVNLANNNATGTSWGRSSNGNYVVGQSYAGGNGTANVKATIWNIATGALINLGGNPGVTGPNGRARAQGISDDGRVVGGFGGSNTVSLVWTDYDGDGSYTTTNVSTASGKSAGVVYGVSADGNWVVGAGVSAQASGGAFRYNPLTNVLENLGRLETPSTRPATAVAVNATGSLIIGYEDAASLVPQLRRGFIWTEGGGMQSFDAYLASWGIDVDNTFNFAVPLGMSADGLSIVGFGYDTSGPGAQIGKGFIVNLPMAAAVPEPSTYAMLLAGLGVTGFVARRRRA